MPGCQEAKPWYGYFTPGKKKCAGGGKKPHARAHTHIDIHIHTSASPGALAYIPTRPPPSTRSLRGFIKATTLSRTETLF